MILESLQDYNNIDAPVIIFGSGPAGLTLALELEKKNIKSIIIEAGAKDYSEDSQKFYEGKVVGDALVDLASSRLRQLGGTSGHWGGWSIPMEDYSFENWPIKYDDVKKYEASACKILNIKNEFRKSSLNDSINQIEFQYSTVRFGEKFYHQIQKSNNIFIILNTQLSHLEGANKKTEYAVCVSNGNIFKLKSKYFILCCGGIENSRILLWSKEKNVNFIDYDSPIGKYWMSHPWIVAGKGIIFKKQLKKINNFMDYEDILHFAPKKELLKKKEILSGAIYMKADEDNKYYKEIIKDILCVAPDLGKKISREIFYKDLKCGNIFMNLEEKAEEFNRIELNSKKKDLLNIPQPILFYKKSQITTYSAKTILEEFGNFCIKNDIGRVAMAKEIFNLEGYDNLGVNHHIGGTRMGENKKSSVVDKNLKVHQNYNLYVCGSSVFCSSCYANPTFTIIQLSLRLASHLKNLLG
jgi:choline dehydrogenase-like flavoprotein